MGELWSHWPCDGGGPRLSLDDEFVLWIAADTDETFDEWIARVMYFDCGCRGMYKRQAAAA